MKLQQYGPEKKFNVRKSIVNTLTVFPCLGNTVSNFIPSNLDFLSSEGKKFNLRKLTTLVISLKSVEGHLNEYTGTANRYYLIKLLNCYDLLKKKKRKSLPKNCLTMS